MKRMFLPILALTLLLSSCGSSATPAETATPEATATVAPTATATPTVAETATPEVELEGEPAVGMANPVLTVGSSFDFTPLGFVLDAPEGATDMSYAIIDDEIAQITFTLDGSTYTLRASELVETEDLHGYYGEFGEEAMGSDASGDLFAYTLEGFTMAGDAGTLATSTLRQMEANTIYLTLLTTDHSDMGLTTALLSNITSTLILENPVELASNITWIDSDLYAVINLGYRGYSPWEDVLAQSIEIWGLSEPNSYELGGDECYLVIPRYKDTNFAIFESILMEDGTLVEGDLLEDINEDVPFVLFCNPSDLYPNHIIHLTRNQITATFAISTSLMDGTLNPMEHGMDLSAYLEG